MNKVSTNSLGYKIELPAPETVEEFDKLAKKEGACLAEAVKNIFYRSMLPVFRANFIELVENQTGVNRETKESGRTRTVDGVTEPVMVYTQTEAQYLDHVCAVTAQERGEAVEAVRASFAGLAQQVADSLEFDPAETMRKTASAGPKKIANKWLEIARKLEERGALAKTAAKLTATLGNWVVEATVESVARGISEDQRRKALEVEAELLS